MADKEMERPARQNLLDEGEHYFRQGDRHKARRCFEALLEADPQHIDAMNNLGVIDFMEGRHEEALERFMRVLSSRPGHLEAQENAGNVLAAMGDYKASLESFNRVLAAAEPSPDLLAAMADCHIGLKEPDKAMGLLNRALEIDPVHEAARLALKRLEEGSPEARQEEKTGRLNIGFVSIWFERGQSYVTKMIRDVIASRHRTFVFARTGGVYGQPMLETAGTWHVPDLTTYPDYEIPGHVIQEWIRNNRLDAVIFNEEYDWNLVRAAKGTGIKVITYLDYYKDDWKPHMGLYDAVLCSTKRTYELVKGLCRAHYMGWAVDNRMFHPRDDGGKKFTFFHNAGWLGINYRKNTPAAIVAFDAISKHLPDVDLFIHSQVEIEKLPPQIAGIVRQNPRIIYHVETTPAPGYYHKGRIMLFPTKLEGLGLPLFEALACGLPVIATDAPPMNEFIRHGENGLLVRVAEVVTRQDDIAFPETLVDVRELALKMAALAQDEDRVVRLGLNARNDALTALSPAALGQRISEILHGLFNAAERNRIPPGGATDSPPGTPDGGEIPVDSSPDKLYWIRRHKELAGSIFTVGNVDWPEEANYQAYRMRMDKLRQLAGELDLGWKGKSVLDVGCGVGLFSEWFAAQGAAVTGIDISPDAVRHSQKRVPTGRFAVSNAAAFRTDERFDVVACIDVLYHIVHDEEWEQSLERMHEFLQEDGILLLVDKFLENTETPGKHVRFRSRSDYDRVLDRLGMSLDRIKPYDVDPRTKQDLSRIGKIAVYRKRSGRLAAADPKAPLIHLVGAQETNYPWGFENRLIPALKELGCTVLSTDFRKNRDRLPELLRKPADLLLVCKGEWIDPRWIRLAPCTTALWYAEQVGFPGQCDETAAGRRKELAFNVAAFDHAFSHDEGNLDVYRALGARSASWLPTAMVDPQIHRPLGLAKDIDVIFVGSITPRRKMLLEAVRRRVNVHVANTWDPVEMNRLFNRSRIVLNLHLSDLPNTETRIAEVLGAGAFLLTEQLSSPGLIEDGKHAAVFPAGDVEALISKLNRYLENEQEREAIAAAGHGHAMTRHTCRARMLQLLNTIHGVNRTKNTVRILAVRAAGN
jgi:glycosyltransferase involved in cell wall biosynthesis/Flp pilus assembly protein TadD